jgi:hypothetical protein
MDFDEAAGPAVRRLAAGGPDAGEALFEVFGLLIAAWPVLAESRPREPWDLFGLDVTAAAELLHIAVAKQPEITRPAAGAGALRRAVLHLVEALIAHLNLTGRASGEPLVEQLEREAAAVQLRGALDAVT